MSTKRNLARGDKRHKETRGRKAIPEAPAEALPLRPAGLATREERDSYKYLRELCLRSGRVTADDVEFVIHVAILRAYLARLRKEIRDLPSLKTTGGNGNDTIDPLVKEWQRVQSNYRQALGQLMLSPRSRSASRLTKAQAGTGGGTPIPPRNPTEFKLFETRAGNEAGNGTQA